MATFKSFEEIEVWQSARVLADRIYRLSLEGSFAKDYELRNQIGKSSGSIMDNIAEGYERDGTREFIQFLSISKGSTGEVRSQLHRALDRHHLPREIFIELNNEVIMISRKLSRLMNYLRESNIKGLKFKS